MRNAFSGIAAVNVNMKHHMIFKTNRAPSAERNFRWRIEESVENMVSEAFCFSVLPSDPFRAWLRNPIACNNNSWLEHN